MPSFFFHSNDNVRNFPFRSNVTEYGSSPQNGKELLHSFFIFFANLSSEKRRVIRFASSFIVALINWD